MNFYLKVNTAPTYIAMIELEKRSPSFEMLERNTGALDSDPPDLFSKQTLLIGVITAFHESVLAGFEEVLKSRIKEFKDKTDTKSCGNK